ncbi:unnamed protein product [Adineta ricciae]|uniref:Uncharacterized protein n=1 Tax=Adineta ricciae TaxID=249248 RepID=A0A814XX08_ADIRI|nr:unnamed protein product [Adineta ricciae]
MASKLRNRKNQDPRHPTRQSITDVFQQIVNKHVNTTLLADVRTVTTYEASYIKRMTKTNAKFNVKRIRLYVDNPYIARLQKKSFQLSKALS